MSEKYVFIDAEYATLPAEGEAPTVVQMCEWLGVSNPDTTNGGRGRKARPGNDASC